jgi:hypothetical protein
MLVFPQVCFSQSTFSSDLAQDLTNVGIAALTGSVIGLSTMAFSNRPFNDYDNILTGGALGILVGVGVVFYYRSKDEYLFFIPAKDNIFVSYTWNF